LLLVWNVDDGRSLNRASGGRFDGIGDGGGAPQAEEFQLFMAQEAANGHRARQRH